MAEKRALVISIDAMTGDDLAVAREYPHFASLLSRCALATDVEGVFPSLTYPCHVSMATGCWPARTGILNNEVFVPGTLKRPWHFYADQIARPTIFAAARAAGVSTGCVMWPCMGRAPVDTLIPEIWGETPDAPFLEPFLRAGSAGFIREIWPIVGDLPRGFAQPMFDEFVTVMTAEVIRRKAPRLLYAHICQIDNAKHYAGLNSENVRRAIANTDDLLGKLLDALDCAGVREQTDIVLCSDHGQVPVHTVSYPNRALASHGLLSSAPDGSVDRWTAQVQSACMSALLYAPSDAGARDAMHVLGHPDCMRELGISEIVPRAEAAQRFHLDGDFHAVLLGRHGTFFHNAFDGGPLSQPVGETAVRYRANHGHDPSVGEKPFFLIAGPSAAAGARIRGGLRLIDEPATIADMIGFEFPGIDGTSCKSMLST